MLSDILEASQPKAKVQCWVTGLSPIKTSKDKTVTSTASISMLESSIVPSTLCLYESALSSHLANVNNSAAAARAVENKSAPHTIISIPKRDGHTYRRKMRCNSGLVASR